MVVYRDSTKFLKFVEWAQKVLYDKVPKPSKDELTFMYVDELGVTRDIKSMDDLDAWLDVMWYKHPPELIVTDIDALMYKAEKKWCAATEFFQLYDLDGNGKIDQMELKNAMGAIGAKLSQKELTAMMREADEDGCAHVPDPFRSFSAPHRDSYLHVANCTDESQR